ncbi:MAG: flagellar hook-associated protein FlgK [Limisphaerales bacterium]
MVAMLDTNVKRRARQQRAIRAAAPVLARAGGEGRGVEAAVIAEARDPLLEAQLLAETSVSGSLAAQQAHLQHAGACLDELFSFSAASNGLNELDVELSQLFSSFADLYSDPANLPLRRDIVRCAQEIAARFNRASARLDCLRNDLNASIQKDVARANQNLNDIAVLNQQILEAQTSGGKAGPLAEQREQCLETLSGCVNLIATPRADGGVNISIGGVAMVSGSKTPDFLATYPDQNEDLRLQAQNAGARLEPAGGSIAGKISGRDGALAGLRSGLNHLAAQLISRFNSIYRNGRDLHGGTGQDFFTGNDATDIGVNSAVAGDPSRLQVGGAAETKGYDTTAPALERFRQTYAETVSHQGGALEQVSEDLSSSQAVAQMLANERTSAHGASIGGELTCLQSYKQACAVSAQVQATLHEMPPVQ